MHGHRRDLPGRSSRSDDEVIGDRRFPGQGNGDHLLGLVVVEGAEDELQKRVVRDRGDRFALGGRTALRGG
jgi:hypothetical protein